MRKDAHCREVLEVIKKLRGQFVSFVSLIMGSNVSEILLSDNIRKIQFHFSNDLYNSIYNKNIHSIAIVSKSGVDFQLHFSF